MMKYFFPYHWCLLHCEYDFIELLHIDFNLPGNKDDGFFQKFDDYFMNCLTQSIRKRYFV